VSFENTHLAWQVATAVEFRQETSRVRTIAFEVTNWAGHLAGQHVDVRLTAEDGYQAQRSYSIASAAGAATNRIELGIEHISDGEVSPYLTEEMRVGDTLELRGPIGGYFAWRAPGTQPLMLIGAGSGVVPLMSILRTRDRMTDPNPARLLYSSRRDTDIIYRDELDHLVSKQNGFSLIHTLTRGVPDAWTGESRRIDLDMLRTHAFPAEREPLSFICGPTAFVEAVADHLVALGHAAACIKTERFGPTNIQS